MPSISQCSIEDVISQSPGVTRLNVQDLVSNSPSILICAAGFETRFDAVARLVLSSGLRLRQVILVTLASNTEKDRENCAKLVAMLSPISDRPPVVINGDASGFVEELRSLVMMEDADNRDAAHVLFDTSVAANRLILRTLQVLLESDCELTIGYTEAEIYHPEQTEFETNETAWTSDESLGTEMGVQEITRSNEYPGEHLDALSNVVVLLPNFRHERSAAVISQTDAALLNRATDDVVWILGRPHLEKDVWRREAMRKINRIGDDAKVLEASTFDYRQTWALLESIYQERWETSNLTISPLGSKLQAVAVTLFCFRHSDVRVLFSTPKKYNTEQWSDGVRESWQISFGDVGDFASRVREPGRLRIEGFGC